MEKHTLYSCGLLWQLVFYTKIRGNNPLWYKHGDLYPDDLIQSLQFHVVKPSLCKL